MATKLTKKAATVVIVAVFWIAAWWLVAIAVNNSYFLPSPRDTALALGALMTESRFYTVILSSLGRVLAGLILGLLGGIALAVLCNISKIFRAFIEPIITVMKAMPVATFIIILWITMSGSLLTIFIGFMMVLPIVFQNVLNGFDSISRELREVCEIYGFSPIKKFKLLTFPALYKYLVPAIITSIGLAFKSQIATEIIAYTKVSIGRYIFDAKYNLNTPEVFAWATVVVLFSLVLEGVTKWILGRIKI